MQKSPVLPVMRPVVEVKSLAAEVSAINAKADEAAKNLRRKGKLRW